MIFCKFSTEKLLKLVHFYGLIKKDTNGITCEI